MTTNQLIEETVQCPYCWQSFTLLIDASVESVKTLPRNVMLNTSTPAPVYSLKSVNARLLSVNLEFSISESWISSAKIAVSVWFRKVQSST